MTLAFSRKEPVVAPMAAIHRSLRITQGKALEITVHESGITLPRKKTAKSC